MNPFPALSADSTVELVSPAAPRSWIATTSPVAKASRQDSIKIFSRNGLPTCTVGRSSCASSKVREANPEAPWIPSRPVPEPTSSKTLPSSPAADVARSALFTKPTHMALTSGFWE